MPRARRTLVRDDRAYNSRDSRQLWLHSQHEDACSRIARRGQPSRAGRLRRDNRVYGRTDPGQLDFPLPLHGKFRRQRISRGPAERREHNSSPKFGTFSSAGRLARGGMPRREAGARPARSSAGLGGHPSATQFSRGGSSGAASRMVCACVQSLAICSFNASTEGNLASGRTKAMNSTAISCP